MQAPKPKPIILVVLDGWGISESTQHNAIAQANTPTWDHLCKKYPNTLLNGSGQAVGLPEGQMGNSEVGHMTIGSGRIIPQNLTRINTEITNKNFFDNPALIKAASNAATENNSLHIIGLLSPGGVHSHENHIHALVQLAAKLKVKDLYIHVILDGRDTPPQSASKSLSALEDIIKENNCGQIASIIGRYYAMDRDQRHDRTQSTLDLLTSREQLTKNCAKTALEALELAYARGETDEFIKPTVITNINNNNNNKITTIKPGDNLIFANFRADRARQLCYKLAELPLTNFVTFTNYAKDLKAQVAFPTEKINNSIGECLAENNLKQLRIAETEKYAHVTFFFNGGNEAQFKNESRDLIASPSVSTYDLCPEMGAGEITEKIISHINKQTFDVIICNFANADMVGHTGNFDATIKAIEILDICLGRIIKQLSLVGGEALITADHGNAEFMYDNETKQAHTAHTNNPVPLVYVGNRDFRFPVEGLLQDIAPTLLYLLGLKQPIEMTGKNLLACQG